MIAQIPFNHLKIENEDNKAHTCDKCKDTPHSPTPSRSPSSSPEPRRKIVYFDHLCLYCRESPHSPPPSPQSTPNTARRGSWNDVEASVGHVMKTLRNKNRK